MPEVKQLDWSKLQPKTPDSTTYRKEKPQGYLKYEPSAKVRKAKRLKFTDKTIFTEQRQNLDHLRSIQDEL